MIAFLNESPQHVWRQCWKGALALLLAFSGLAHAQLTIDVTTSAGRQIPIAVVEFRGEAAAPQNFTPIIINNLARTGLFRIVNT
ncbi:MAG: hypothetical protein ACK5X3_19960, partial [Pseudomonadota bacterium]